MTASKIRDLGATEISDQIIKVQKNLFELRFKQATKQTIKTHLFKKYKNALAQLMTVQHQFKNSVH